jgi:hypothetical protein
MKDSGMSVLTRLLLCLSFLALISCGGGGGDDSDEGGSGGGGSSFQVSVDRTSVAFDFNQGSNPASQVIRATWTGTPPEQVYVAAILQGAGLSQTIPVVIGETSATVTLNAAGGLAGGTYNGQVSLLVCADQACAQRIGGSPIQINYTVNVRTPVFAGPGSIVFQYTRGTTIEATPVALNIAAGAGAWTASANASFITLSKTSGNGAGTLEVFFNPEGLASSSYQGTVTVTGASGAQTVSVTLNLTTPVIGVSLPPPLTFEFSGINGAPFTPVTAGVAINTTTTLPMSVSSNQPWLVVSSPFSSAPGNFTLTINPALAALASGVHAATLRIEVGNGNYNVVREIPVSLSLTAPTLSFTDSIVLGGPTGRDFEQVSAQVSLNTGTNAYAWSVAGVPAWLGLNRTSGSTSSAGQPILLEPQPAHSTPGTSNATLIFTAQVNGDTVTKPVPVSFNLDTHRLIASENGIAFVTTADPAWRRLDRTIRIRDNMGLNTAWTASDDAAWLSTTTAGNSGDNLVIHADPAGLSDGLHIANIAVESPDTTVEGPEIVRVGLWVSSAAPPSTQVALTPLTEIYNTVRSDPIRPYVYAHQTNANSTSIRIFNVYTETEVLPAINGVPAGTLDIAVSTDGSLLFAMDRDGGVIARVNLDTRVVEGTFSAPRGSSSLTNDQVEYARPNGVGVVLTNGGDAYLAATGRRVGTGLFSYFDITADQSTAFVNSSRHDLDYTSAAGGMFLNDFSGSAPISIGFSTDIGVRADGTRVYVGGGSSTAPYFYGFFRYDGVTLTGLASLPNGGAFAQSVEIGSDGRVFTASSSQDANHYNIWVYDSNDVHVRSFLVAQGMENRGLVVSGDGFIALVNRGLVNPGLERIPVGP